MIMLRSPCLQGLAFLRQVLAFQEDPNPRPFIELPEVVSEDDVDVPWLRWRCVGLAAAMDLAGLGEESAVAGWLKDAENDPLPELRSPRRNGAAGARRRANRATNDVACPVVLVLARVTRVEQATLRLLIGYAAPWSSGSQTPSPAAWLGFASTSRRR